MLNIDDLKFNSHGLIPAIVVDATTKKVLTLAYMNRESLEISMAEVAPASGPGPVKSSGAKEKPAATSSTSWTSPPTATGCPGGHRQQGGARMPPGH